MIWTTGAVVIAEHGVPRAGEALAYLAGALLGMAVIVVVSFGGLRSTWVDIGLVRRAYGAIHALSVVSAVLVGWLLAAVLDSVVAFLLASLAAVVVYHLLLAVEVALSNADVDSFGGRAAAAVPLDEREPPIDADSAAGR